MPRGRPHTAMSSKTGDNSDVVIGRARPGGLCLTNSQEVNPHCPRHLAIDVPHPISPQGRSWRLFLRLTAVPSHSERTHHAFPSEVSFPFAVSACDEYPSLQVSPFLPCFKKPHARVSSVLQMREPVARL